jgi:hypothetical protein
MMDTQQALPHWTWGDLEAALDRFSPVGADDPVRSHLMRGLRADAEALGPRDLLQQVLSAGWVMAQVGARVDTSATDLRPAIGASAS